MFPIVSLRTMTTDSFDPETLRTRVAGINAPVTMTLCGLLPLSEEGEKCFLTTRRACLTMDKQIVLSCQRGLNAGKALLQKGVHRFDFICLHRRGKESLKLRWLPPGTRQFTDFSQRALVMPAAD